MVDEVETLRGIRGQVLPGRRAVAPPDALEKVNRNARPRQVAPHQDPDAEDATEEEPDVDTYYGLAALRLARKERNGGGGGGGARAGSAEPWELLWPMAGGELATSRGRAAALADLEAIWAWAIQEKMGLSRATLKRCRVIVLLPDVARRRLRRDLLQLLLVDLGFYAAMLHYEPVAASFAAGLTSACVINVGHATTNVCCVADGLSVPSSRIQLPYGFAHVASTLHWLMCRAGCFRHDGLMTAAGGQLDDAAAGRRQAARHARSAATSAGADEENEGEDEEEEDEEEDDVDEHGTATDGDEATAAGRDPEKGAGATDVPASARFGQADTAAAQRATLSFAEKHCTLALDNLKPTEYAFDLRRAGEDSQQTKFRLDKEVRGARQCLGQGTGG